MTMLSMFTVTRCIGTTRNATPTKVLVFLLMVIGTGRVGYAELLAYEGFEYEEFGEQVLNEDGGFGFTRKWGPGSGTGESLFITEGSLRYGELQSSGNRVFVDAKGGWQALLRSLSSPIGVRDTGTLYASFLIRPERGSSREIPIGWGALGFLGVIDGHAPWAGYSGRRYAMSEWAGGSEFKSSDVTAELDQTTLFVVRADMTPGQDTFTFYVNPVLGEPEPDTGIEKSETLPGLGRIWIGAGNGAELSVDEIRIGETYADVTPVLMDVLGDFDGSDVLDAGDIDALSAEVRAGTNNPAFDLTNDGLVNDDDRVRWVKDLANSYFGDANLDGEFNSGDLVAVFQEGKYEVDTRAGWSEGDWNADLRFESGDLVVAFQDGGYELGPPANLNAVPEPASLPMVVTGLIGLSMQRRHRRSVVKHVANRRN